MQQHLAEADQIAGSRPQPAGWILETNPAGLFLLVAPGWIQHRHDSRRVGWREAGVAHAQRLEHGLTYEAGVVGAGQALGDVGHDDEWRIAVAVARARQELQRRGACPLEVARPVPELVARRLHDKCFV